MISSAIGARPGRLRSSAQTMKSGRMFKHILIPTDGSDLSRKAVLYGVQLAKECGAKVTALTLTEPYRVASMDAVLVSVGEDEYEEESRRIVRSGARAGQDRRPTRPACPATRSAKCTTSPIGRSSTRPTPRAATSS